MTRAASEDPEPRVRAAAVRALCAFGADRGLALLAEELFATGPSYQVMAAAAGLLACAAPERAFEFLERALELESSHGILTAYLARTLADLPDARVPAELRRLAADRWLAPSARAVAVECLASTSAERLESSRFLASLLEEESFHLRLAVVRALASFDDPGARRALANAYPRARTAEERRIIESRLARAGA